MRRLLPLVLTAALAATASAQTGLGMDFGLDAGDAIEKSEREDRSRPFPYAIALEMEFSSATWLTLDLASAPAKEMTALMVRGYYKLELVELVLTAEKARVPFKEVFKKREKGATLKAIAAGYGLDADQVYDEAAVRRRHLESELLPGIALSTGTLEVPRSSGAAAGVSLSTAPAALPPRRPE